MQIKRSTVLAIAIALLISAPEPGLAASFKVLHQFTSSTDGSNPRSSLIFDKAGNLYGTTVGGGLNGGGMVFELSPDGNGNWTETILYNFQNPFGGAPDGEAPVAGLTIDAQGNLYGTTQLGGITNNYCQSGCGVAFELSPGSSGWNYQVIYSFSGMPDGAFPSSDVIMDAEGNLYGVTSGGGSTYDICVYGLFPGCGTVFELVKANGWKDQILHSFAYSLTDGTYPSGKLLFDSQGNLYGTTTAGGDGAYGWYHGTAFEMKPSNGIWTEHVIYNFCSQVDCDDGSGPGAGLIKIGSQLYVTAVSGGGNGYYGGVFELKESGGEWLESSYLFDISDGAEPWAPVLYRDGALYGVTEQGGIQNGACTLYQMGNGVVFKISILGETMTEKVLYEFTGGSDGCGPVGGLVADAAGNLYGTAWGNGSANGGTVFEVSP
jgi:uncharacterized repeat protein (TIGR03803 family)